MIGASFDGPLYASLLQVGGSIWSMGSLAQNTTTFKSVNLISAKIAGQVVMTGASFDGRAGRQLVAGRRRSVHGFLGSKHDDF